MKHVLVYGMTDNPGGIETYLTNLFLRVQGNGIQMDFVSDFPRISGAETLTAHGAKLHFIPAKGKGLFQQWKALWKLLRAHPEYQTMYFNVLDAGAALTMLIPFVLGRKLVVHSHNGSTDKMRLHKLCRPFLKLMTAEYVACSGAAAVHMFGSTKKDVLVIPNAIDAAGYAFDAQVRARKRRELGIENKLTVCHVGRISNQKNPFGLIDIFEALHEKQPESVLLSVGDGEMADEFHAYIAQKPCADAVHCLGRRSDIPDILQAADVFLLPSFYEGLPIVAIEAQAAGLPCVLSDAITAEVVLTDLVQRLPLSDAKEKWAASVLAAAARPRENTYEELVQAGYDISCCAAFDAKLCALF